MMECRTLDANVPWIILLILLVVIAIFTIQSYQGVQLRRLRRRVAVLKARFDAAHAP